MTKTIGPKEAALKAQRQENAKRPRGHADLRDLAGTIGVAAKEAAQDAKLIAPDNGDVPDFLKRQPETDEQREKRLKKYQRPDHAAGVKAIEPVTPMPDKIRKAIEKDLRDDPSIPIAELHKHSAATPNRESWNKIPAVKKAQKQKLPPALAKALAEKEKLESLTKPEHSAKANQMESNVKKSKTKKPNNGKAKAKSEKSNGAIRAGSKLEMVAKLLQRPQGCTSADVLKATGWPSVSMPAQAKAAGLKLKKEKKDGLTHYSA